jgi:transcriptional regulator with XRE-family HTH domain
MENIHMGQLLERVIRRKGINISELAAALGITRRTLYNWFKLEIIDEDAIERISNLIVYDLTSEAGKHSVVNAQPKQTQLELDDQYWQDRYIDLLERYSILLTNSLKDKSSD